MQQTNTSTIVYEMWHKFTYTGNDHMVLQIQILNYMMVKNYYFEK